MAGRLAAVPLLLLVAACSVSSPGSPTDLDSTVTGSIATPAAFTPAATPPIADALQPADWTEIRDVAAARFPTAADGAALDWSNPASGSTGTLTAASAERSADGLRCRAFSLTVSDIRGVRGYRGDACHVADGAWQLYDVKPDDGVLH